MPKLAQLSLCLLMILGLISAAVLPVRAEDDQFAKIDAMNLAGLEQFVGLVTASVGQDTLKLRGAADRKDCLELYRAANAFGLGYRYLARVNELIADKSDAASLALRARVVQSRVIVFAARVRAEEFVGRTCDGFVVPAENAADVRFAVPTEIALADYTAAVIEAREAAEVIFLGAAVAAKSQKCAPIRSIIQSIELITPYLQKLAKDIESRPAALGPRASRTALDQSRVRLITAANQLDAAFGGTCNQPAPAKTPAAPAPANP